MEFIEKKMKNVSLSDNETREEVNISSMETECVEDKKEIAPLVVIDDILHWTQSNPEKTNEILKFLMFVLTTQYEKNGKKPIPYYQYIIDTSDFEQTNKNMVYTSIIISRGMARLDIDEQNGVVLWPVATGEPVQFKSDYEKNTPLIISMSYDIWEKFTISANGSKGYLQEARNKNFMLDFYHVFQCPF